MDNNQGTPPPVRPTPSMPPAGGGGSGNIGEHKVWAIIGYIIPILFFIPLLSDAKKNPYAKFHANQQLNLLLFWVIGQLVASVLTFILIGALLFPVIMIAGVIFLIMGVINAANGSMKRLPLIGKWELIK